MPWLSCYLNPLTLTCLGREMAASCLTFPLCSRVTVSSYSFMVIADKQAPAHTLHTSGFEASSAAATSSVWHGLAAKVTFLCLLTVMGTNLLLCWLWELGGCVLESGGIWISSLWVSNLCVLCWLVTVSFPHSSEAYFLVRPIYGFLNNYFSTLLAVIIKAFYCRGRG